MTDDDSPRRLTVFAAGQQIAAGPEPDVGRDLAARGLAPDAPPPVIIDDATGRSVDIDLRASVLPTDARPRAGRGRPRLGVVPREVTLLPRHWDWLASQRGGASVALRRLVDQARRESEAADRQRRARDCAYHAMSTLAGDLPGFEEASRALFSGDDEGFRGRIAAWPEDIRAYLIRLLTADTEAGA